MYTAELSGAQVMLHLPTEVAKVVKSKEPGWTYIAASCRCGRITAGELEHDVGSWKRRLLFKRREHVRIDIFTIASAEEATEWMNQWDREIKIGWPQVKRYELPDEAYLLDHRWRGDGDPYSIFVRKRNMIVQISGNSLTDVERFARYAVSVLPAT